MTRCIAAAVVCLLVCASPVYADPPALTYDQALTQTDQRDLRVIYSTVRSFVERDEGRLAPWGQLHSSYGNSQKHNQKIITVAKQTAFIAASLYMLKYPYLFSLIDPQGELYSKLLQTGEASPISNCSIYPIPSVQYEDCCTLNLRHYYNSYLQTAKLLGGGVGTNRDYDMAFASLISLLYVFRDDADSLHTDSIVRILDPAGIQGDGLLLFKIPSYTKYKSFHETENHVLMIHAWNILATHFVMWMGRITDTQHPRHSATVRAWYTNRAHQVYDHLDPTKQSYFYRRILMFLGRIVHSGYFETNSRPYNKHILHPIIALAQFAHMLHAEDSVEPHQQKVQTAARNALNYTATKFAFESLRGKRNGAFRRRGSYARNIGFYWGESAGIFHVLSGAVEYDDCSEGSVNCKRRNPKVAHYWFREFWTALGRFYARYANIAQYQYELPPAIHGQMFNRRPFYARMQARYGVNNYPKLGRPPYFDNEETASVEGKFVGSPEVCFGTDDVIIAGGSSFLEFPKAGLKDDYNFYSRPTMIYGLGDFGHGYDPTKSYAASRPFGSWHEGNNLDLTEPPENALVMYGEREKDKYWKSTCNNLVYKNFVYGYERLKNPPANYHTGWPQHYPADWDVNNLAIPAFYVQDAEFKIYSFNQGELGSNDPQDRTRPYFVIMGRLPKNAGADPGKPRFHRYRRGTVEVIPKGPDTWETAEALQLDFLRWNNPGFDYFSAVDRSEPFEYVLTMSKERLTLASTIGSGSQGENNCVSGIEKIEVPLSDEPSNSQGEGFWIERDLNEDLFPSLQKHSDNRRHLPLIAVWELNSEYDFTGHKLVEVVNHDAPDKYHDRGELQRGHILVRRPIKQHTTVQVGDNLTVVFENDAWECLDINSHNYLYPSTLSYVTQDYRDCGTTEPGLPSVKMITAGALHTCAKLADETAWCWGQDDYGQLGNGPPPGATATPTQVLLLETVATGELEVRPISLVKTLSAGAHHTCAIQTNHRAWCWGDNAQGQLGNAGYSQASSPVPILDPGSTIGEPMRFRAISSGALHTCAITPTDTDPTHSERLYCWGDNDFGQIGDGTTSDRLEPVEIPLGGAVLAVSAGSLHTCAVTYDGVAWCWGYGADGQLGDGRQQNSLTPVVVEALDGPSFPIIEPFVSIAAGGHHTCAVSSGEVGIVDATPNVWCWGNNNYGQIGDGTTVLHPAAMRVPDLVGRTALGVSLGANHSCALVCDLQQGNQCESKAWCWGSNNIGQLGKGSFGGFDAHPVAVLNLTQVVGLSAGNTHGCALVRDGDAHCWGSNSYGQIGDGQVVLNRSFPSEVFWP